MKSSTLSARDMAVCALGAGLLTISAWISVPVFDIAFTLQTFAVILLLELLGTKRCAISCLVYLGLGLVGLPVFSGFRGGISMLLGVTGGYIWGFLGMIPAFRMLKNRYAAAALGMLVCYSLGSGWYWLVYTSGSAGELGMVLLKCVIPYLLPDTLKICLAFSLSARLRRAIAF